MCSWCELFGRGIDLCFDGVVGVSLSRDLNRQVLVGVAWVKGEALVLCGRYGERKGYKGEFLETQDGGAVGVAWPFPSVLASGPLRALNTSGFSSHTPDK